jgi:peptidyl-prolyl cis-trans isomerase D
LKGEHPFAFSFFRVMNMFDFFRNNIKFLMVVLIVLIIPAFVLFGVEGYSGMRESRDVVAHVGKIEVTRQQWDAAHRNEMDGLAAQLPGVDRSLFDNEASRLESLERLVSQQLLALAAQDGLLVTTDARLARELTQDPTIASLRRDDGSLDVESYQQLLRAQGMTAEMFEASVRGDLVRRQVLESVLSTGFVGDKLAAQALDAFFEQREVQVAQFRPADFRASVQVNDDEARAFYEANLQRFVTVEQMDVEYVVLSLQDVAAGIRINEADVRDFYEQNQANQALLEERRARHILLTTDGSNREEAQQAAQALLTELRTNPERFEALAREQSQDPGSATAGGDLGFFGRGSMVKPFEDAVFALQPQQISDVVETEFGFHIIQVTDVRTPDAKPFAEVRADIEAQLRQQTAQRQFAEAAEEFANLVYEQSDSLEPAAKALGLTIQRASSVRRTGPADAAAHAVLNNPRLLSSLFSDDAVRDKRNTEAVEVGGNQLVGARVAQHYPVRQRAFDEVQAQARETLLSERALASAREQAQSQLQAWQGGANPVLGPRMTVSRIDNQDLPPQAIAAALSANAGPSTAAWTQADLGEQGVMVIRVNNVLPRATADAQRLGLERQQLAEILGQAEAEAYMEQLRKRYKVEIKARATRARS